MIYGLMLSDIIEKNTDPSMTRMEAWKACQANGMNCSWSTFKRLCGRFGFKFKIEKGETK